MMYIYMDISLYKWFHTYASPGKNKEIIIDNNK